MSLEKIVKEAMAGRPLEMKEAFEQAIEEKVVAALEAKYDEMMGVVSEEAELEEELTAFIDDMLEEGYEIDDIIESIVEQELEEGSIKGSGSDRKAQLKKAYRAGEHSTKRFYGTSKKTIPVPKGMRKAGEYNSKHSDKGVEKAFNAGKHADDGRGPRSGDSRSKSQDTLSGTDKLHPDYDSSKYKSQIKHDKKKHALASSKPKANLPK